MNKTFHSVWNARKQAYVAAAETVSAKGKPSSGIKVAAVMAGLMGSLLGNLANAQTAPPPSTLPTGGQVSAGQASISQSGANMVIQQSSNRAAINWQTFNLGKDAQLQFQQPSASSVTLNRVLSADPSQIFGRISANGQVILSNPAGVYFGKDTRVDVGGLVATTHGMNDADFMAGKSRFERNGSTGSVVNEGELKAALGGYIALLAPEVRNQGAVIAHMGTVALAAGEAVDLKFDVNNRLTSLRVEPSQIAALVDNRHAVQAPGGLIIISAQSMDRLVGGVVKNSGRIEANGLQQQGGRIMLSASHKLENTGSITANATVGATAAESGPAGRIEISAPQITNSGSISATGSSQHSAGSVLVQATQFTQTDTGRIDLSAPTQGGTLSIQTTGSVQLQGSVNAQATQDSTTTGTASGTARSGGQISIAAQGDIALNNATIDASGGQGGHIQLRAKAPAQPDNPNPLPETPDAPGQGRLAMMGQSTLSSRGRNGQGGTQVLLGDHLELLDNTTIDASGATGGGSVYVGGGWQGSSIPSLRGNEAISHQASTLLMAEGASIHASATTQGKGGTIVLWSNIHNTESVTRVYGTLMAEGGGRGGDGGQIETSGFYLDAVPTKVSASAAYGQSGVWLLDPYNITIGSAASGTAFSSAGVDYTYAAAADSTVQASSIVAALNVGTNVTVSTGSTGSPGASVGDITVNSAISATTAGGGALTLEAARNILLNANVSTVGATTFQAGGYISLATNLSTAGTLNFNAPVRVTGADRTVTSSSGNLNFNSTIDSFDATVQGLSLTATNGGVLLTSSIGSINPIFDLNVNSSLGAIFRGETIALGVRSTSVSTTTTSYGPLETIYYSGPIDNYCEASGCFGAFKYLTNVPAGRYVLFIKKDVTTRTFTGDLYATTTSVGPFTKIGYVQEKGSTAAFALTLDVLVPEGGAVRILYNITGGGGGDIFKGSMEIMRQLATTVTTTGNEYTNPVLNISGNFRVENNSYVSFSQKTSSGTFIAQSVTGTGSLTQAGSGTLALSVGNTYSGGTTVNGGTLSLGASNVLPNAGAVTVSGGTLAMGSFSNTVGALTLSAGSITGTTGVLTGSSYTVNNSTDPATISAILGGSGALTKSGAGTLTLSGANTYTGTTTINGGVVSISADNHLGAAPVSATLGKLVLNNGTLQTTSDLTLNAYRGITLTNTGEVDVGSGTTLTYGGIMAGAGSLTKTGLGTLSLSGQNTYGGVTTIGAGTLAVTGALADSTALTVDAAAIYSVNASDTVASIAGGGTITTSSTAGTRTLTVGGNSSSTTFAGVLQNNGSGLLALTKSGTGTLTLTGNSTYTGDTSISGGTLQLANDAPTTGGTNYGGAGTLQIAPASNDFSADFSTSGWNFGTSLGGLVIGKASTADGTGDRTVTIASTTAIAGPISVYGGDVTVSSAMSSSQASAALLLKASGSIGANANITTNNGSLTLWSNASGGASGGVTLGDNVALNAANGLTTATSGGGNIVIAGGADDGANGGTGSDGIPDGFTTGTISASNLSMYSGGGNITVRGSSATGAGVSFLNNTTIHSGNGRVVMRGESSASHGISLGDSGQIGLVAISSSANDAVNPAIDIDGRTTTSSTTAWGLGLFSNVGGAVQATGTGGIRLYGQTAASPFSYYAIGLDMLATSGPISLTANGGNNGLIHQGVLGRKATTSVTTSSSNIELVADKISALSQLSMATSGQLTVKPLGTSFSSDLTWPIPATTFSLSSDISGLTIGKTGNTANITLSQNVTVAGSISIYGGNISSQALSATGSTLTLQGTGNVTLGGNVTASSVRLLGGNVAFNGSNNTIGTLAASGVGSLSLVNSGALTIGTMGSTNGVSASGAVSIATKTGDLTVAQNISTTDSSAYALVLNAGKDTNAGTSTGGNIVLSGSPSITVGSGARATLYTGSVSGSTGLTTLVGSGSGHFRYNSDEISSGYDTTNAALGNGLYAVYREQPTITVTAADLTTQYSGTPTFGVSINSVNGDTAAQALAGVGYSDNGGRSSAGHAVVGAHTITASGASSLLGYAIGGYQSGTLTVNAKPLTVTGTTVADKDYDGTTGATLSGGGLVGVVGVDKVNLVHGGSFDSKHAANTVTVTVNHGLEGDDIGNYSFTQPTGLSGTIHPKGITANAAIGGTLTRAYNGTTSASGASVTGTIAGAVAGDSLAFVGSAYTLAYNDAHVLTANSISASGAGSMAISSSTAGSLLSDYVLTQPTIVPVAASITPAPLTSSLANTSVTRDYNGNTDAPAGFTPTWTITGLVSGDTAASLLHTGAAYNSKDVLSANKVTVTGVSVGSITGNKGSQPSDYEVASSSDVAATITPKSVTLSGLTATDKVYDGRTDVVNVTSWGHAATGVGSETLALTHSAASLSSANAGTRTVSVSSYALADGSRGELASNYLLTGSTTATTSITIGKAALTVHANNDAKFVTTLDASGYAGVGYSGFVNGETDSVLSGGASVSRSNAGANTAGSFSGVLVPDVSGLSANNYSFVPANGSYTIVPSNQLLVRVNNASSTYGSAANYAISSVEYFNGSTPVALTNITSAGNNQFTVADGASSSATFTLAPLGVPVSGAGKAGVGLWQLGTGGPVTENSQNFTNTITVVGAHLINTKAVTASAGNVSKVYDGTTAMVGVTLNLSGLEAADVVNTSGVGAMSSKNAGSGLTYSVDGLVLGGADAANYHLSGGASFSGHNGVILSKAVTLNPQAASRVYNGSTAYTASAADLTYLSNQLGIAGDTVSGITLVFNDKNVATGKTMTATASSITDGNNGNNYTITLGSNSTSSITRLNAVTWVGGGSSNNWFDPANWAGGAVPDLANVANVVIPTGVTVSFDKTGAQSPVDTSGVVSLDSLGTQGSLSQANGTLNIGSGGMVLGAYTQSGGTLNNAGTTTLGSFTQSAGSFNGTGAMNIGNLIQTGGTLVASADLTVTDSFSQGTSGSISVGGNVSITDTSGGTVLGNLRTGGDLVVNSTDGAIIQATGTVIETIGTSTFTASSGGLPADIKLDGSNDFKGTVNADGQNITLKDVNNITLGNVQAGGDLIVDVGGDVIQDKTPPNKIVVAGKTKITAGGDVLLDGDDNDFKGTVNIKADDITIKDKNDLTLGDVDAGGDLIVDVGGDVIQDKTPPNKIVVAGKTNITAGGDVLLDGDDNKFTKGVTVKARSSRINGDDRKSAQEAASVAQSMVPVSTMPGSGLSSTNSPQTLVMSSAPASSSSASSSGTSATAASSATSSGVTVDMTSTSQQDTPTMVAVSLPKGASTVGTGFSFELPESVRSLAGDDVSVQASRVDGSPLPAWLKFDQAILRFEANAVPDSALPMQVAMVIGGQRLLVVISERTE